MGWTQGHEGRTPEGEESWGIRPCFRKVLRLRATAPPTPPLPRPFFTWEQVGTHPRAVGMCPKGVNTVLSVPGEGKAAGTACPWLLPGPTRLWQGWKGL